MLVLQSADGASATIHHHGAHTTRWKPAGDASEQLFLSPHAVFKPGTPIRGGVPVIFPQFAGEGPLPKHGFARTAPWALHDTRIDPATGAEAVFVLRDSDETRAIWPAAFTATLRVRIGGDTLQTRLHVLNEGDQAFKFTAALHTYLAVADIGAVEIEGLDGLHYRDTADGGTLKPETARKLRIVDEVDRIYFDTPAALTLRDGERQLQLRQKGFNDTVVWNPGAELSQKFADLAAEDYRRFVCIEAATIGRPVVLSPGGEWQGEQILRAS